MAVPTFPLMGFSRHRLGIDGQGVTTLATAWGCPLRCAYCLNPQCQSPDTAVKQVTAGALVEMARVDDLYFQATGGGVTFGGGEPLTHAAFIRQFRRLCPEPWRITVETSLNVPLEDFRATAGCVDEFLVDIKDMNPATYRRYTGRDSTLAVLNLRLLLDAVGPGRVIVRVPHIPGYNTPEDVARSAQALRDMGVRRLDVFKYRVKTAGSAGAAPSEPRQR